MLKVADLDSSKRLRRFDYFAVAEPFVILLNSCLLGVQLRGSQRPQACGLLCRFVTADSMFSHSRKHPYARAHAGVPCRAIDYVW